MQTADSPRRAWDADQLSECTTQTCLFDAADDSELGRQFREYVARAAAEEKSKYLAYKAKQDSVLMNIDVRGSDIDLAPQLDHNPDGVATRSGASYARSLEAHVPGQFAEQSRATVPPVHGTEIPTGIPNPYGSSVGSSCELPDGLPHEEAGLTNTTVSRALRQTEGRSEWPATSYGHLSRLPGPSSVWKSLRNVPLILKRRSGNLPPLVATKQNSMLLPLPNLQRRNAVILIDCKPTMAATAATRLAQRRNAVAAGRIFYSATSATHTCPRESDGATEPTPGGAHAARIHRRRNAIVAAIDSEPRMGVPPSKQLGHSHNAVPSVRPYVADHSNGTPSAGDARAKESAELGSERRRNIISTSETDRGVGAETTHPGVGAETRRLTHRRMGLSAESRGECALHAPGSVCLLCGPRIRNGGRASLDAGTCSAAKAQDTMRARRQTLAT